MRGKIVFLFLIAVVALGFLSQPAHADLLAVGPIDATNGFPVWYQDTNGLTLDYCLPRNAEQHNAGVCLILPTSLDPLTGIDMPFVFPTNYPDEAFYWNATAVMDLQGQPDVFNAVLVLGLEAAFATGPPIPGNQVVFGRLRITVDAPVLGNYTITTPFGTYVFPVTVVDKRVITFTSDIGIGSAGDFTGALNSDIGPFLLASATEGGLALPPVTVPGDPSGDLFLSDTALTTVTGSPGGTNYFEICTDSGVFPINNQDCVRTNLFSLMGRIFNGTPFVADNSYYVRNVSGAGSVYVYGTTNTASATAVYEVSGTGLTTTTMTRSVATGDLFAAVPFLSGTTLPASVTITATDPEPLPNGKTPTAVSSNLTDLVTISRAAYDRSTLSMIIQAESSDQAVPPTLTATGIGTLVNGLLIVSPVIAPPVSVTVTSSQGGSDTAIMTVFSSAKPGVYADGIWYLDLSGNGAWDGTPTDSLYTFGVGLPGAVPVTGDWNGSGTSKIGVYADGSWYLDMDGSGAWEGSPPDSFYTFGVGLVGAVPVSGDWNGSGTSKIGVYADGLWYLDVNGNGIWDGTPTDSIYTFGGGLVGAIPVTGDWNGSGTTKVGMYVDGLWYMDSNGNGTLDAFPVDLTTTFGVGLIGAIPFTADTNGGGIASVGVYVDGIWYIDYSGNGAWDGTPTDIQYTFGVGLAGARPVTGNW